MYAWYGKSAHPLALLDKIVKLSTRIVEEESSYWIKILYSRDLNQRNIWGFVGWWLIYRFDTCVACLRQVLCILLNVYFRAQIFGARVSPGSVRLYWKEHMCVTVLFTLRQCRYLRIGCYWYRINVPELFSSRTFQLLGLEVYLNIYWHCSYIRKKFKLVMNMCSQIGYFKEQ